jgi:integrase
VRVEPGIYRRPDGKLEIGFRNASGTQKWQKVDGGIKAARAALATEHARRARGERTAADPRLRFDAAADVWWQARALKLRPATQSAYSACLIHLRATFARRRMTDITPSDVAAYVTAKQAEGLKGWTIKGRLTVLSSVYSYAARHLGLVGVNPCSLLDRVERPSSDDERPKRILTADELARLLAAVEDDWRPLFTLAAETGGRLAEVLGLTWQDIDLESQTIAFTHQLDRTGQRVQLKTKRSRRVLEVTPSLVSTLRRVKLASARSGPHDLVFTTKLGTPHDHRNVGGRVLSRAVKRAGLGAVERGGEVVSPAPTTHSLRHSHASALIAAAWDIAEVSARLGHSSIATTTRIYVHQFDSARRTDERRSRLNALYGSTVEAPVEATDASSEQQPPTSNVAEVHSLRADSSSR